MSTLGANLSIHAALVDYARLVQIWLVQRGENQDAVVEPIVFTLKTQDLVTPEPVEATFSMTYELGQRLVDALIEAGIRPSNQGNAGHLNALKAHLQDMRTLVFRSGLNENLKKEPS